MSIEVDVVDVDGVPLGDSFYIDDNLSIGGFGVVFFGHVNGGTANSVVIKLQKSREDIERESYMTTQMMSFAEPPEVFLNGGERVEGTTEFKTPVRHIFQKYNMLKHGYIKLNQKTKKAIIQKFITPEPQSETKAAKKIREEENAEVEKKFETLLNRTYFDDNYALPNGVLGFMIFERIEGSIESLEIGDKETNDKIKEKNSKRTEHILFGCQWMNYALARVYGFQMQDNHSGNIAYRKSNTISLYRMRTQVMEDDVSLDDRLMKTVDEICFAFPPGYEFVRIDIAELAFLDEDRRKFWIIADQTPDETDKGSKRPQNESGSAKKRRPDEKITEKNRDQLNESGSNLLESRYRTVPFQVLYNAHDGTQLTKKFAKMYTLQSDPFDRDAVKLEDMKKLEDLNLMKNDRITTQFLTQDNQFTERPDMFKVIQRGYQIGEFKNEDDEGDKETSTNPFIEREENTTLSGSWFGKQYGSFAKVDTPEQWKIDTNATVTNEENMLFEQLAQMRDDYGLNPAELYRKMYASYYDLNLKNFSYYMSIAYHPFIVSKKVADSMEKGGYGECVTYYDTLDPNK